MARPTIKDVARESGYSIATVSFVVNNKDVSIPKSTRDAVWEVVHRLGYQPNQLAVGMITRKTKIIGLIIPDNSNNFFADLAKYIEIAAEKRGYNVIVGNSANNSHRDLTYMEAFVGRQVEGIIYTKSAPSSYIDDRKIFDFIQRNEMPMITIDRFMAYDNIPAVMLNQFKGGYLAARHLIELGHTRIGCYTGPFDLEISQERLEGYRSALAEANLPYDPELIFEGNFQMGLEEEAFKHFIQKKVTAVFAFNDIMAIGLYRAAQKNNYVIPRDMSIVGFDDIWVSQVVQPSLTTIRQPIEDMAECALDVLLRLVEGKPLEEKRIKYTFEPHLEIRDSSTVYIVKE